MNQKILNIVKFTVTDRVGNYSTNWDLAAVFYEDGRVELVSPLEASKKANQANIRISESTPDLLVQNYDKYRSISNFDLDASEANVESPDLEEENSEEKDTEEKNNTQQQTKSVFRKKKKGKKKSGFFGKIAATVTGFVGGIVMGAYGKVEQLADWLTVNVLGRFNKKKKEKKQSLKEKAFSTAKAVKENAKDYVKQSVANRKKSKTSKVRKTKKKGKRGIFKKLTAAATAFTLALGLSSCANPDTAKNAQPGQIQLTQDELKDLTDEELLQMINSGELSLEQVKEMLESGEIKNDILDNLSYEQLLQVTNSTIQQQEMTKVGKFLDYFNGNFANKYLEVNHPGVRAVLTWEEVNAINLAYNNFTKEDVQAIFNGEEIRSADFTSSYKEATLQLMGAFVLETRDTPVNLDSLLNTQEGKDFYKKYNDLFLKCKETTGQEQLKAVNAFYQELYKDFPISDEVREVGISHSESRDDIESYKLVVTPMVAAAEMMFQDLEVDSTLSNKGITYFNDLGLCEFAQGEFDRAEQIMLNSENDNTIPTYEQFMNAKVKELTNEGIYFVSDAKRDISQYDLFQKWVNGHFKLDEDDNFAVGDSISQSITTEVVDTYTTTDTTYHTETTRTETSDRNKAVAMAGEEAVRQAEAEVNRQLDAFNATAKAEGEAEAEKNRQEMQAEADKEAEKVRDEIAKDDQDLQDKIDSSNDQIAENNKDQDTNNDTPVNEDDLGHGVDFDENHSNEQGDLDDSVIDITTGSDESGTDLPDSNESGAEFDQTQPDYSNQPEGTFTTGEVDDQTFVEYEEPVAETATYTASQQTTLTNEQIVDVIVNEMANNPTAEEEVVVYTK